MRTFEPIAAGRDNNFNLIRMVAASAVIVSHSFPIALGPSAAEPMQALLSPLDLGKAAVQVFFAVSGYLVTKSFDRRSLQDFAFLRAARIVPGYMLVSALTAVLMLFVSFAHNVYPNEVNGSLWTLGYEALCYAALMASRRTLPFLAGFAALYYLLEPTRSHDLVEFALPFMIGLAIWRFRVPLRGHVALALALAAAVLSTRPAWSLALSYGVLWLATVPLFRSYNKLGDYSYGTYIFAWPIQQLLALAAPGIRPIEMMAIALPSAWALGVASWHCVEQPSLTSTRRVLRDWRSRHRQTPYLLNR